MNNNVYPARNMAEMVRYFELRNIGVEKKYDRITKKYRFTLSKDGIYKDYFFVYPETDDLEKKYEEMSTACLTMYNNFLEYVGYISTLLKYEHGGELIGKLAKPVENKHDGLSAKVYLIDEMHGARYGMVKPINVIFNGPATIVFWNDGTKTIVKCSEGDTLDYEKGLAMAFSKKLFGNKGNYRKQFKKWLPKEDEDVECLYPRIVPLPDMSHAVEGLRKLGEALKKRGRGM